MKIYFPEYYKKFRCIAAACPDSCCKEWTVDVDEVSAARYRALEGALGDRLRSVLKDTDDGTVMQIENRRCPMWQDDGLCRIQAELGHDALCQTCRDFPRLRHDYGDFAELGLELSCPEAARLILTDPKTDFICETIPGGEDPTYDAEVMTCLRQSRTQILDFLDDRSYTVREALSVLLLYAHEVQAQIDGGAEAVLDPKKCLSHAKRLASTASMHPVLDFFKNLEILTPRWRALLNAEPIQGCWNDALRALARYGVLRYWLQAVSDFDLVCRAKLVVISCLLVNTLGGDVVQTTQLFSKEIENDPDNIDAILDAAYTCPAFTDLTLLNLLAE